MPPETAKLTEKTAESNDHGASAAINRTDIAALLAEHRTTLLADLKISFSDEVK